MDDTQYQRRRSSSVESTDHEGTALGLSRLRARVRDGEHLALVHEHPTARRVRSEPTPGPRVVRPLRRPHRRLRSITVIAQKSRIVIMGRVRFAGAVVHRERLTASFALTRRLDDPRFRIVTYSDRWNAHRFEVRSPADLEIPGLPAWLCESYSDLGMQAAPVRRRRSASAGESDG